MVGTKKESKSIKTYTGDSFWHLFAGIVMIFLGIYIVFNPQISLLAMALYFGLAIFIVGFSYIIAAFTYTSGWYVFSGILNVLIGFILMANLGITAATLPFLLAIWAVTVGSIQLASVFQLKKIGFDWGWTLVSGIVGVLFGFLILMYPVVGVVTLSMTVGMYVILYGFLSICEYFCCRLKS